MAYTSFHNNHPLKPVPRTITMASFQVTRDLRSASQDPKRAKEHTSKWARGTRPPPGERLDIFSDFNKRAAEPAGSQRTKARPESAWKT